MVFARSKTAATGILLRLNADSVRPDLFHRNTANKKGSNMSVAKIIEVTATSPNSFEEAVRNGVQRAGKTVDNIEGVWIKEQKAAVENNQIVEYRVDMKVTFMVGE
jgi:dodecin